MYYYQDFKEYTKIKVWEIIDSTRLIYKSNLLPTLIYIKISDFCLGIYSYIDKMLIASRHDFTEILQQQWRT